MADLTLKQIRIKKLELDKNITKLIREFELYTEVGIDEIKLEIAYQFGTSHSLVVSVETKLNVWVILVFGLGSWKGEMKKWILIIRKLNYLRNL